MSENCYECGQVISKAESLPEILAAIKKDYSIHSWSQESVGTERKVPNLGTVTLIDRSDTLDDDPGYSELDIHLVFGVHDGLKDRMFKIEGDKSSYDGTRWNSWISPVQKRRKEVWVYE